MIDIILVEPENPGNIGSVARVMKNFGFKNLVLVKPKCDINDESRRLAKHANDMLKKAKTIDFKSLEDYDYLIGTTSKLGSDYNIPRCTIKPEELAKKITKRRIGHRIN